MRQLEPGGQRKHGDLLSEMGVCTEYKIAYHSGGISYDCPHHLFYLGLHVLFQLGLHVLQFF